MNCIVVSAEFYQMLMYSSERYKTKVKRIIFIAVC